jgi:hypothetical protein
VDRRFFDVPGMGGNLAVKVRYALGSKKQRTYVYGVRRQNPEPTNRTLVCGTA